MNRKFEISFKTIVLTVGLIAGLWLLFLIRDILLLLFIAFLLMTALHPMVTFLERIKIPRVVGIVIVYLVIFGFFGVSVASAIPALILQSNRLLAELPSFTSRVLPYWNIDSASISQQIAPIGENVVKLTIGIFSNIVTTLTVLVFTFYFLIERRHTQMMITNVVGEQPAREVMDVLRDIEARLGGWVRGELVLMFFIGLTSYIGLTVLHIEFALPLAILAGLLEIVPMIGPIVSAIPAVLVALATSPILALTVAALYFLIQQVENNVLVPWIMNKSVGFSPLVTILAVMIGGSLAGIVGALLGVPFALVGQALLFAVLSRAH